MPCKGTFAFRVRLDIANSVIWVGVCTEEPNQAWALSMFNGELHRCVHRRGVIPALGAFEEKSTFGRDASVPPPTHFPDGDGKAVLPRLQRIPTEGWSIDVIFDATNGALAFRLDDDGKHVEALRGFPPGAALRPFVCMLSVGDRVTMMTRV